MNGYTLVQPKLIAEDKTLADRGSSNHSAVQANLAFLLKRLGCCEGELFDAAMEIRLAIDEIFE